MLSHHIHPGGTTAPQFLVTTTHADGTICHHTGATREEVDDYAAAHADDGDKIEFFALAPARFDGVHWQLVA